MASARGPSEHARDESCDPAVSQGGGGVEALVPRWVVRVARVIKLGMCVVTTIVLESGMVWL